MKDIDFLPADYRQRTASERGGKWRLVAAGALLLFVVGVDCWHRFARHAAETELATLAEPYLHAQQQKTRLATLQQEIKLADEEAQLMAFLDHRWPVTQLLAVPATNTNDAVRLVSVKLQRQAEAGARAITNGEVSLSTAAPTNNSPSKDALVELRRLSGEELLIVTGTTRDAQAAHAYVTRLNKSPLVRSAKLQNITREGSNRGEGDEREISRFIVEMKILGSLESARQANADLADRASVLEALP